jgi:protein-S-isoprenylcysteine O-methyltransferase Ste14
MIEKKVRKNAAVFMSWFVYVIIFFEMIYMATPFAIFFYSVYGAPLKWLNASAYTTWLIQPILPHFSQTNNLFINTILIISWPLMLIGLLIFLVSFFQIYWAKLTKKGAVSGGIYRYIRHPQYVAWCVFGLGMSMVWSRMIVLLMFVTMLFTYYWLARSEEKECLQKYGDSYRDYMARTGMFFPKLKRDKPSTPFLKLPNSRFTRTLMIIVIYTALILMTIGAGQLLRTYAINQLSTYAANNYIVLSLTPITEEQIAEEIVVALNSVRVQEKLEESFDLTTDKLLIYLMPASWEVSELGIEVSQLHESHSRQNLTVNPLAHGNISAKNHFKKLIFSEAVIGKNNQGIDILRKCRRQFPRWIVIIDIELKQVTKIIKAPVEGRYKDIPVPLY